MNRDTGAWEKIIKNSPDIICTTDRNGYFISINEACEAILGYTCQEMIGRSFSDFLCPVDLANSLNLAKKVLSGHKTTSFENSLIHKNGLEVQMAWSAAWSEEEEVVIGVGRDVTERKLVKKKEELYQALVEHGSDMLALFDEELNFLYTGPSTFKEIGYRPEELIGTSTLSKIHPDDVSMVQESVSKVLASKGHTKISDFRYKDAKGEWRWLETTLSNQLHNPAVKALVASSRDITERISSRLKLQESEQRFKSLFDHHLDIVLFQDKEGKILDLNAATLSFFKVQKQEIINRKFSDFIPPEKVHICRQAHQEALDGKWVRYENKLPVEGKGLLTFDIVKIPVIVHGEIKGVYSILRDVTEISHSNHIIRQQATKLNNILESITDAFFTLDRDWNFTYINSELERLFQTDRNELLGKNIWKLFPNEVHGTFYQQYSQAVETGIAAHFESYFEQFDKWLQVKAYPSEEGLSIFLDDITERVHSKQELEKLSLVASKTTNGIFVTDSNEVIEWVNEGFSNITGYVAREVIGKIPAAFLPGEETDRATIKRMMELRKKGEPFKEEILGYKKSGEKVWFSLSVTPVLNEEKEVIKHIHILSDVTFRKETEAKQLQLTQDLFRQNRDLQQFTYIVSHNLRSPLANAMGLANLLAMVEKDSESFDVSLAYLRTSIQKMDTVLKDLNNILSIREEGGTVEREDIPLATVCQQAMEELLESLRRCNGEAFMEVEEDILVRGNKAYIYSIFHNLFTNAIKYRSPKRALRIRIKCFGSTEKGTIISFSDNGAGFDMQLAGDKVFQLYKRFHTHTEGRGMGLFLVKTQLEAMGGHIEVSSKLNAGTTFFLYFR